MAQLAGIWTTPCLDGDQAVATNGVTHAVPADATVKLVHAGKLEVVHVRIENRVYVLSQHGQLIESDNEAKSRATEANWRSVAGT